MMNTLIIGLQIIFSIAKANRCDYNIGCLYPSSLDKDPFEARNYFGEWFSTEILRKYKFETPLVIRASHMFNACQAKCLSMSYPKIRDPITLQPETFLIPPSGRNAYAVVMCSLSCYYTIFEGWSTISEDWRMELRDNMGIDISMATGQGVKDAIDTFMETGNPKLINEIMIDHRCHPYISGQIAGRLMYNDFLNDGWNQDGSEIYDLETEMERPCTSSCRPFQDPTGYRPVNDPRYELDWNFNSYDCEGDCRKWQPLLEADGFGSLKKQEFVVPHIGTKGHWYLRMPSQTLETPMYDYHRESLDVIEHMRETAESQHRKEAVAFHDDKLNVRNVYQQEIKRRYRDKHTFQAHILFLWGLSLAEYDGALQGWLEKRHHDLVRPTTVIKSWGTEKLYTFGGDLTVDGAVEIDAADFEATIRVMPHPEHPSGSSCLCSSYTEFTNAYTTEKYGSIIEDISTTRPSGFVLQWDNFAKLHEECGESRLWGGLHYPQAIPDGEQICAGLGTLALNHLIAMENGETYETAGSTGPHFFGDLLPECPPSSSPTFHVTDEPQV